MRVLLLIFLIGASFELSTTRALGAGTTARGGPYFEYHTNSLSSFDPRISGNAFVIGGVGYGSLGKSFRLGGGGGGGFLWDSSNDVSYGMGYGGAIGQYLVAPWMSFQMMIGGGGFSVARVITQTDTTTTLEKISAGGFVLFYPSVCFEVNLRKFLSLSAKLGYFLPNNAKLHSFTLGLTLLLGEY